MPNRRCIFCKRVSEKKNLIRIVNVNEKMLVDKEQKISARGVYFCNKNCMEKFITLNKKSKNITNLNLNFEDLKELIKNIN